MTADVWGGSLERVFHMGRGVGPTTAWSSRSEGVSVWRACRIPVKPPRADRKMDVSLGPVLRPVPRLLDGQCRRHCLVPLGGPDLAMQR